MKNRKLFLLHGCVVLLFLGPWLGSASLKAQQKAEGPYCGKWINSDASNHGALSWGNIANARCDEDAARANTDMITGYKYTHLLQINNFAFQVPLDAEVTGIEVVVIRKADMPNSLVDRRVSLTKPGRILKQNKKSPGLWENNWTAVFYGGEQDLWNEPWTPAEINSIGFGVVLSAEFGESEGRPEIDEVLVTVHYVIPGEAQVTNSNRNGSKFTCNAIGG